MDIVACFKRSRLILTESAILERLGKNASIALHPQLAHALLMYSDDGRQAFHSLYREIFNIALETDLPLLIHTPTWRAGRDRIKASGATKTLNADAVGFMRMLARDLVSGTRPIFLGGLIGPLNDCYQPKRAPDVHSSERYHGWQIAELATAGADFLLAATLPAVPEAMGLARAMQLIPQPYFISFVIDREGYVLDGTKLSDAIDMVDRYSCDRPPLGYWINCAYPSFLDPVAMTPDVRQRLVGYQANASSKNHTDLDGCDAVCQDDINDWVARMASLYHRWGLKIMGGCCGTGPEHLRHLVDALSIS